MLASFTSGSILSNKIREFTEAKNRKIYIHLGIYKKKN